MHGIQGDTRARSVYMSVDGGAAVAGGEHQSINNNALIAHSCVSVQGICNSMRCIVLLGPSGRDAEVPHPHPTPHAAGAICLLVRAALLDVCNGPEGTASCSAPHMAMACMDAPQGVDCCRWHLAGASQTCSASGFFLCVFQIVFFLTSVPGSLSDLKADLMLPRGRDALGKRLVGLLDFRPTRLAVPGKTRAAHWSVMLIRGPLVQGGS